MIAELVLSVTFLGKHFCSKRCDDRIDTTPGSVHEGVIFVGEEGKGE